MQRFSNILFCPLGDKDNPVAIRRVADLTARNHASLSLLGVVNEPSWLQQVVRRDHFIEEIREAERKAISAKLARCIASAVDAPIATRIVSGNPALSIIERVLLEGHDLVVVTSDENDADHAATKRLLRKCPCPVWVIRPTRAKIQRVLAAVNPDPLEFELNRMILDMAASMVTLYGGELHVVHTWELDGEATLRSSAFMRTPAAEVEALLASERSSHHEALHALLAEAGVDWHPWQVHLRKGRPGEIVPDLVSAKRINLLVMGTVARTGVAGLIMGNTAETVLDKVRCSVLAVKPPGFVSPIELLRRRSKTERP